MEVRGPGAGLTGDDDRRHDVDLGDLGVPPQVVDDQQSHAGGIDERAPGAQLAGIAQADALGRDPNLHRESVADDRLVEVVAEVIEAAALGRCGVEHGLGGPVDAIERCCRSGEGIGDPGWEDRIDEVVDADRVAHGRTGEVSARRFVPGCTGWNMGGRRGLTGGARRR